jgi:hypothetical protein
VSLGQRFTDAAHELRRGHIGAGTHAVEGALAELARLLSQPANAEAAPVLLPWLQQALEAQGRSDWTALADCLEHGLATLLD